MINIDLKLNQIYLTSNLNNQNELPIINSIIKEQDLLIIIGNSFTSKENIIEFYYNCKCKNLIYITGDRDNFIYKNKDIFKSYFIDILEIGYFRCENFNFICCYYPLYTDKTIPILHGYSNYTINGRTLDISWLTSKYYMGKHTIFSLANAKKIIEIQNGK